ncbi:UNVERIFIED_CONTAM: hypothetical protein HDU68_004859 [Siphonaria sp. JEL0065]|nr:hypothetical protein HDU68_004859 [Siphonaria sp. JEL0065]
MHTEDQQSQPLGNSLAFVLDRRFSLPMSPANSPVGYRTTTSTNSNNLSMSSATFTPHQQQVPMFQTHQLSRRMSLNASSFMYQPSMPSMTEMLHGSPPLNNAPPTAILDSFTIYNGHRSSTDDLNLLLPSDFSSAQQIYITPSATRANTPSIFDNAFNELMFEKPSNTSPQFEFSFFKDQQILQQQQQFQQQIEQHCQLQQSPKPTSQLETIHQSTVPTLLPLPEFYNTNHTIQSPISSPQQDHVSPPNTVLKRVKQADSAKSLLKFKPTESQLSTLIGVFEKNPFPSAALRNDLADMLDIQPKQVRFWFQNRRATYKMNGVYVIKPKKTNSGEIVTIRGRNEQPTLAPISENPYFFVEVGRRGSF